MGRLLTTNEFPAAPVTVSRDLLRKTQGIRPRGAIINSWCANSLTGKPGLDDAVAMCKEADKYAVGGSTKKERDSSSTMVMSTSMGAQQQGKLHQGSPKDNHSFTAKQITRATDFQYSISAKTTPRYTTKKMGSSHLHRLEAAQGICTTDTFLKLLSRTFTLASSPETAFSTAGITKGASMINPNMATILGVILLRCRCHSAGLATTSLHRGGKLL